MSNDNDSKEPPNNKTSINEIEVEQKDIIDILFNNSASQFESQLFLSRKRALAAENGQTEKSELLKTKLKALDMMILILSNNKKILKEKDLSCCEVLNNLLCISKKDKAYGEHIYSRIKDIIKFLLRNKINLEEKNIDSYNVLIKFLITILNINFDNGYFKQCLEIISNDEEMLKLFFDELLKKLFKGRNIIIKLKEIKFIIKAFIFDEKIRKILNFFEILEKMVNFLHEKDSGGCRTYFQLNQVTFLLQYLMELLNNDDIKNHINKIENKDDNILNMLEHVNESINEFIDKNDYQYDKNKINKKELMKKNDVIKRKKTFFSEMNNFLKKFKKNFQKELEDKKYSDILNKISDVYKNNINQNYIVVINSDNKNNEQKNKNKEMKSVENNKKDKYEDKIMNSKNDDEEKESNIKTGKEGEEKEDKNIKEEKKGEKNKKEKKRDNIQTNKENRDDEEKVNKDINLNEEDENEDNLEKKDIDNNKGTKFKNKAQKIGEKKKHKKNEIKNGNKKKKEH